MLFRFIRLLKEILSGIVLFLVVSLGLLHMPLYAAVISMELFRKSFPLTFPQTILLFYGIEAAAFLGVAWFLFWEYRKSRAKSLTSNASILEFISHWWLAFHKTLSLLHNIAVKTIRQWTASAKPTSIAVTKFAKHCQHNVRTSAMVLMVVATAYGMIYLAAVQYDPNDEPSPTEEQSTSEMLPSSKSPPSAWSYRLSEDTENRVAYFDLFHGGRRVYTTQRYYFLSVIFFDENSTPIDILGDKTEVSGNFNTQDVTGDGVPDILLVEGCGCSADSKEHSLISLGKEVKEIYRTDEWEGEWYFSDINGDGMYEAHGKDFSTTRYDAGSDTYDTGIPAVPIILRYQKNEFRLATNLMKHRAPKESEFFNEVEEAKQILNADGDLSESTYAYLLELIYSGNGEIAHRFLSLAMSGKPENEREFFWSSFLGKMRGSPYWQDVAALNNWAADQYAFKECPY